MPTYGYECKSCGHTFDAFQSMSDEPIKDCPECGKEVRRLINGGTGIIFKGSGFYVTDRGKGGSAASSSKSSSKSSDGASAEPSVAGTAGGTSADKSAGSSSASGASPAGGSAGSSAGTTGGDKPRASEAKQPVKS